VRIVLDTNFFVARQFDLSAADLQILGRAVALGAARLVIPEVVVAEVERKFHDILVEEVQKLTKSGGKIARLTGVNPASAVDVEVSSASFNARFAEWRTQRNVVVPPTSAIGSDTLVTRALQRKKPFKGTSDEGMRDAIIWEAVMNLSRDYGERVILVSTNTHDFADTAGTALHPDLAAEVKTSGKTGVLFFADFESLRKHSLDKAIVDKQEFADLKAAVTYAKEISYHELFTAEIIQAIEASAARVLPSEFESPKMSRLEEVHDIKVRDADAVGLEAGKVAVVVDLGFDVTAEGRADKGVAHNLADNPGFNVTAFDPNEWDAGMEYWDVVTVRASLIVEADARRQSGFQINNVEWRRISRGGWP